MNPPVVLEDPALDARLRRILAIHFDPADGAPYWLERAAALGFDPRREIRIVRDLPRLGLLETETLRARPLADFLPRSVSADAAGLILARTGGTLGPPAWTAWTEAEFDDAFVEPFLLAARHVGFPGGGTWLYAGPAGPHIIGRAAEALARRTGSATPFGVDFDAAWARRLPDGSFAAERYRQHVLGQVLAILRDQPVDTLFSTPALISALAEALDEPSRRRIRGIHYGGLPLDPQDLRRLQTEAFPRAVHLAGYGNTLFGCCLELDVAAGRTPRYFPHGRRLVFGVLPLSSAPPAPPSPRATASSGATRPQRSRLPRPPDTEPAEALRYAEPGAEGRLVFTRLDHTMFLANVAERDRGRLIAPPADAPAGFHGVGVEAPGPLPDRRPGPGLSLY